MKTALVTGASRGLGLGLVRELLARNYEVFATCRHPEQAKELMALAGPKVHVISLDVEDSTSIAGGFHQISTLTDRMDLLVNSAGVNSRSVSYDPAQARELPSLDRAVLMRMFAINTVGPIMMVKQFLSLLATAKGCVVNISSERASFANQNTRANYGYCASKVALYMMTKELTFDLDPLGVGVFCIDPGWVKTDMSPNGTQEPQAAAHKILDVAERLQAHQNGHFLDNTGGVYPL